MFNARFLVLALFLPLAVVGCSNSTGKSQSATVPVYVYAGQQDVHNAYVRSSQVLTNGLPNESASGLLQFDKYQTDKNGGINPYIYRNQIQIFQLVNRPASDNGQTASTELCQWVEGCNGQAFGSALTQPEISWRSVAYSLNKDEKVYVTPFTELAAALAFAKNYNESNSAWEDSGYFSPYSVEQAISQVSKLLGVLNVQSSAPANLARINSLSTKNEIAARDSIRYGALVAAWRHLAGQDATFTNKVSEELLANNGQLMQKDGSAFLPLNRLYSEAKTNLEKLSLSASNKLKPLIKQVVSDFDADLSHLQSGELTQAQPDTIEALLGSNAYSDYQLGLERTKSFVSSLFSQGALSDLKDNFFSDEYKEKLDDYANNLKLLGEANKDNINLLAGYLLAAKDLYLQTASTGGNTCASTLDWASCNYDSSSKTMVISGNGTQLTLTQTNNESLSQAVDINLEGTLAVNGLVAKIATKDDVKPRIRVFYGNPQTSIVAEPVLALDMYLSSLNLQANSSTSSSTSQLDGYLRLFYRGVQNPSQADEYHYNIDTFTFGGSVFDGQSFSESANKSSLYLNANASLADLFYNPDEKYGKFNGFFTKADAVPTSISDLVSYEQGSESLNGQTVNYFDYRIKNGESVRYRFYPTVKRVDDIDSNANGNYSEKVDTHNMSICPIIEQNGSWVINGTCTPTQRIYRARDVQRSINDLWKSGALSYVSVPGQGEYFVTWNAASQANGCYALKPLSASQSMGGIIYNTAVLGLDTLRFRTEVQLKNQKKTLFDVLVNAPSADRYKVTAALSHAYSSISTDEVYLGNGSNLDRILVHYNTDSGFKRIGGLSIYKSGVTLGSETNEIDAELMAGLNQAYDNLPYKWVNDKQGNFEVCVTANTPAPRVNFDDKKAVYSLSFRGVVYGSLRYEDPAWVVRLLDGTFTILGSN